MHGAACCFPSQGNHAESFYPVYEELHSDPGKIIETITAYFKKMRTTRK